MYTWAGLSLHGVLWAPKFEQRGRRCHLLVAAELCGSQVASRFLTSWKVLCPPSPLKGRGLCTVCQTGLTGTGQFSQEGLSLASLLCLHQWIRRGSPFPLQVRSHPLEGVTPFTSDLRPCPCGFHLSLPPLPLFFFPSYLSEATLSCWSPNYKFV